MASKKAAGSTKNGRDSKSKRLGCETLGRSDRECGNHHRSSARNSVPCRSQRENGPRSYDLCRDPRDK